MKAFRIPFAILSLWMGVWTHPPSLAQVAPVDLTHQGIYQFLDELGTEGIIELYSAVKPYSRREISEWLTEADGERLQLTRRQLKELDFYLLDYRKELPAEDSAGSASWLWQQKQGPKRFDVFYHRDSLFQITVNPILGGDLWVNKNGTMYHWWNGVEARSYIGKFALWASVRDNHESTELTARDFQNQRLGASNLKFYYSDGKRDYWEVRAGITYGWKWGHVGLIMGQFAWGEHQAGSNILSGRTPAFPRIELSMDPARWFRFTYIHGALVSEVVDSTLSFYTTNSYGTDYREVYHPKYLAANIFTFTPWKGLHLSVGNSVVYDYRHPHAAFLLPVAFYKSIDHTLNARINNMNSQLFLSASSRNLKNFHFYGNLFFDEVAVGRFFDPNEHNFLSWKLGLSSTLIRDVRLMAEYTWSNALVFRHDVPTTTFESNSYNLGHYLEDNARELYLGVEYAPVRTLRIRASFTKAEKGPDHTELGTMPRAQISAFEPVVWESVRAGVLVSYQMIHDLYARIGYEWRNVTGEQQYLDRWTPDKYHGKTGTWRLGLTYGF